jgi:GT2 family glycosyltransferase
MLRIWIVLMVDNAAGAAQPEAGHRGGSWSDRRTPNFTPGILFVVPSQLERTHPRASVIIPSYRGRAVLPGCLDALDTQDMENFEVIVVDDASGDGTAEWLRTAFPAVRVIAMPENVDFCRAVNAGVSIAQAPIVAFLNDDTVPESAWLRALVEKLESDDGLGFVASRMLSAHDPTVIDGAGDGYSRHGLAFRVGRGERDLGQHGPRRILWASGGASAYRRCALEEVGLLDVTFRIYYEDVDIGLALFTRGWGSEFVPESVVLHLGGFNDQGSKRTAMLCTRNSIVVLAKHWPWRLLVRHAPWIAYGQLRTAAWALRNGLGRPWLRGLLSGIRAWRTARRQCPREAPWAPELDSVYPFGRFRLGDALRRSKI